MTLYNGQQAVLPCHGDGYPPPRVAWVSDGVVLQNRSSDQDTNLVIVANGTKGTTAKYECWANNAHGKDLYVVTATFAGKFAYTAKDHEFLKTGLNRIRDFHICNYKYISLQKYFMAIINIILLGL